ncbi:MAG: class I SAM-dependent methyltransferase [Patescibacteria group bacterium]|nr:class I SAM-dependent methyltransferase [Patescibacteria group bacterium]
MKCAICQSDKHKVVFNELGVDVYQCAVCGQLFSAYGGDQYYDGYFGNGVIGYDNFWWNEAHQKMYDDFCSKYIAGKSGKLLDVGCGLGFFVKKVSHYQGWEAFGYEISKAAVNFAQTELKLNNIFSGKVEEADFPKNYFDIVTLWDVVEHLPSPDVMLNYINLVLHDDGILFIHTPNAKVQLFKARIKKLIYGMKPKIHYLEARDHLNIYTTKTLPMILRRNNFQSVSFTHLHPIQSISGSGSGRNIFLKNLWYHFSRIMFWLSFKKVNFDNLFIAARKQNK